jgi:hypothetical protein
MTAAFVELHSALNHPRRIRCTLTNSCREPTKELNCDHGVLISDQHFDAFLKCRTKAHFTLSSAGTGEPSHPISDWQGRIVENYQKNCRDYLRSASAADCFVGTPRPEDLRNAKYPLILQPLINNRTGCRIPRSRSRTGGSTNPEGAQPLRADPVCPT